MLSTPITERDAPPVMPHSEFAPSEDQVQAIEKFDKWFNGPSPKFFSLIGPAGTGKCLGLDTPVMLYSGEVIPVQDVQAGMQLMGPDSEPRTVESTSKGRGPLYRVTPTKGAPWVCNDAHIMMLTGTNHKAGQIIDVSVIDILKDPEEYRKNWKLFRVPTKFPARWKPSFDPYLFGVWLGDGTRKLPQITNCEPEIIDYCKKVAPSFGLSAVVTETPRNNSYTINFKVDQTIALSEGFKRHSNGSVQNPMTALVSQGKRIDDQYLCGSESVRMEVLAGILDTDGFLSCGGFEICQKDTGLANDILFLARSLGFAAYSKKKIGSIKSIGFEGEYNRIFISGDVERIPCKVPRRQAGTRKQIKRVLVTGFKLESIGDGDYYGFTLNRDGRFLLGDFTVTHNTTIAKHLAALVDGTVYFMAFTGKAALVMQQAGCLGASTIHSLIYQPQDRSKVRLLELRAAVENFPDDGYPEELEDILGQLRIEEKNASSPIFKLKSDSPLRYAKLAIIDECSMIDEQIGKDLLSFGIPILALGDPGQLPPVFGQGYFTGPKPSHLLTQIHRQAKDSPIIQMATTVRTGGTLTPGKYGCCEVIAKSKTEEAKARVQELVMAADQIIVGRNKTRQNINRRTREVKGYPGGIPVPGDKLICLRNNHDLGILNGSLWELEEIDIFTDDQCNLTVKPYQMEGPSVTTIAHMHHFQRRIKELDHWDRRECEEFDFGYAITCHKSQGSQWGNVLVIDESDCFGDNASKHLYTAITRAIDTVTVIV